MSRSRPATGTTATGELVRYRQALARPRGDLGVTIEPAALRAAFEAAVHRQR